MAGHGETIAILAEDEGFGEALRQALAKDGYSCVLCPREEAEALGEAAAPPALVLADTSADANSAFALCRRLRARAADTGCRLIVMHGSGRAIERRRAAALGADGFLAKPFALEELRREVARLLDPVGA